MSIYSWVTRYRDNFYHKILSVYVAIATIFSRHFITSLSDRTFRLKYFLLIETSFQSRGRRKTVLPEIRRRVSSLVSCRRHIIFPARFAFDIGNLSMPWDTTTTRNAALWRRRSTHTSTSILYPVHTDVTFPSFLPSFLSAFLPSLSSRNGVSCSQDCADISSLTRNLCAHTFSHGADSLTKSMISKLQSDNTRRRLPHRESLPREITRSRAVNNVMILFGLIRRGIASVCTSPESRKQKKKRGIKGQMGQCFYFCATPTTNSPWRGKPEDFAWLSVVKSSAREHKL